MAAEVLPVVDNPALAGERHLTAVKLCDWLHQERGLDLSYPTVVRYIHEHDHARRILRPMPEPPDRDALEEQREVFATELVVCWRTLGSRCFSATRRVSKGGRGRASAG